MNKVIFSFASLVLSFLLVSCGIPGDSSTTTGTTSSQPTITATDFSSVTPCSDRDTLPTNTAFLNTITNATSILHIHHTYATDTDLPALCGLQGSWNPSTITEKRSTNTFTANLAAGFFTDAVGKNNAKICRTGFSFVAAPVDVAPGFPAAGTYRGEACVEQGGNAYRFRVRTTVSGTDADAVFTAVAGVTNEASLAVYDSNGTLVNLQASAKSMVTDDPSDFTFTIRSNSGANTHLTVRMEIICVKKLSGSCPAAN